MRYHILRDGKLYASFESWHWRDRILREMSFHGGHSYLYTAKDD